MAAPGLRFFRRAAAAALAAAWPVFSPAGGMAQAPAEEPAAVLNLDPYLAPGEAEANLAPSDSEVDLSAPGMTGHSSGTAPIMLVETAYLAHRRGDFQAAIDGYTRIIRRRGLTRRERAVTYLLRGEARRDSGALDEAVADFTRALRQWPGYPAAHYFRGRVYEKRGQLTEAYADLSQAAQLDPAREAYQTSLNLLRLRLEGKGLPGASGQAGPAPGPAGTSRPGD